MSPSCQANVLLLLSSDAPYYRETAEVLQATVAGRQDVTFELTSVESPGAGNALTTPHELIVAIGSHATRTALAVASDTPLLSIFIPKNAYDALQKPEHTGGQRALSVIYLDQPLQRVVRLATLLAPNATRFATAYGPISREWETEFTALTAKLGIDIQQVYLDRNDNPMALLRPLVSQADLFIALPDQAILNRAIAKWLLQLSFQQKVPVVGFSKAYTNAGALASIYSAPADIGKQAGEWVANYLQSTTKPAASTQYPLYFTISTNPAVARSLGVELPPEAQLYREIEQLEQPLP